MSSTFLGIWRAFAVGFFSLVALAEISVTIPFVGRSERLHARTGWLHRWSRLACRVLGISVTTRGSMSQSDILVCNNLSYLDVVVLSSIERWDFMDKSNLFTRNLFVR